MGPSPRRVRVRLAHARPLTADRPRAAPLAEVVHRGVCVRTFGCVVFSACAPTSDATSHITHATDAWPSNLAGAAPRSLQMTRFEPKPIVSDVENCPWHLQAPWRVQALRPSTRAGIIRIEPSKRNIALSSNTWCHQRRPVELVASLRRSVLLTYRSRGRQPELQHLFGQFLQLACLGYSH
jgi:hypothetical protein